MEIQLSAEEPYQTLKRVKRPGDGKDVKALQYGTLRYIHDWQAENVGAQAGKAHVIALYYVITEC